MWNRVRGRLGRVKRAIQRNARVVNPFRMSREIDALYGLLYDAMHDWDSAVELASSQTRAAFATQWETLPEGRFLLTDPAFRENVDRILCEQELQIRREWFPGRRVLDAGCGNGRWSYGFLKLGAELTAVDINAAALKAAGDALASFENRPRLVCSPLESVAEALAPEKFDLVFSWGVLHHCKSFTGALEQVASLVDDDGVLFVYLYGEVPYDHELGVFKDRIRYNLLQTREERMRFLLEKAGGRRDQVHGYHDAYAPLINRRMPLEPVRELIQGLGFERVEPTIRGSGVWLRAIRRDAKAFEESWGLPPAPQPYWFEAP